MHRTHTALALAAMLLTGCAGSKQPAATLTSTVEITKTVTVTAPAPPSPPKTIMETDGTYRIGIDIVPGTYHSGGTSPGGETDCYWERLDHLNPNHIIANEISAKPQTVTIPSTDTAFTTHSCQTWQKAD
jgi:hypothetical protein